jgi:hypothetical protein
VSPAAAVRVRGDRCAIIIIAVALCFAAPARAARPYARPARIAYLADALAAVRALGPAGRRALEDELQQGARRRCRGDQGEPSAACLVGLARARCAAEPAPRQPACHLAADVVLANRLAEPEMVDEATRARFVGQGADYREAMRAELSIRRANLAAEFALAEPGPDGELPARVDRFCARRDRPLAWQRCVAALVWTIGSYEDGGEPP